MRDLTEKTKATTHIFKGRIISLQVDEVELPNGQLSQREIVKHPGAVAIIPFTADGRMVLVRQFRKALEKVIYEIPAGKLEKGESPEQCARRELEEETGYSSSDMNLVTSFYTSPGFANEYIYIFEAKHLTKGSFQPDHDEFVEVIEITPDEGKKLLEEKKIDDAKTVYALLYWQHVLLQEGHE